MLATLATAIDAAVATHYANNTAGGLCVQVTGIKDPACVGGSCASSQVIPAVRPFPTPASNVWIDPSNPSTLTIDVTGHGATTGTITVKNGLAIPYYDQQTLAYVNTSTASKTVKLSVPIYTILTGVSQAACTSGGVYNGGVVGTIANQLFPATDPAGGGPTNATIPAKAIWNFAELNGEASYGIHNLPWTNAVIGATSAQIHNYQP